MSRFSLISTGLPGLIGSMLLTFTCIFVMAQGLIPAIISRPLIVWGLFLFLLTFSVLEIPIMIFSMQKMIESVNPKAKYVVLLTNTAYTFFASVYAAPFILLTGQSSLEIAAGGALASLSIVRFITSLVFLPHDK